MPAGVQRAGAYDTWFSHITSQANEPLLDALEKHLGGARLLDVCTGTGYLAAAAAKRGALAEGLDFSREMVERARANHPTVPFREGDAEQLPYDDRSFDHVVCAFGHLHLPNADQAIAEALRVLKPGGRYAFAVWRAHPEGYFQIVIDAIGRYGKTDVGCHLRRRSSGLATRKKPSASYGARDLSTCKPAPLT